MRLLRKFLVTFLAASVSISVLSSNANAAKKPAKPKVKISKPSSPTIVSITSSAPKKNRVNLIVSISLPENNGGSLITGSRVSAKGASCSMSKLKTTCTIKNVKVGKSFSFTAQSKNKAGFGAKSPGLNYVATGNSWSKPVEPVAQPVQVVTSPVLPPVPVVTPAPSPPSIVELTDNCARIPGTSECGIFVTYNEPVSWNMIDPCSINTGSGGGDSSYGAAFNRIGYGQVCNVTYEAISLKTNLKHSKVFTISIPDSSPVATVVENTCESDALAPECGIQVSYDESVTVELFDPCDFLDGWGGDSNSWGAKFSLRGEERRCFVQFVATSNSTNLSSTKTFTLEVPSFLDFTTFQCTFLGSIPHSSECSEFNNQILADNKVAVSLDFETETNKVNVEIKNFDSQWHKVDFANAVYSLPDGEARQGGGHSFGWIAPHGLLRQTIYWENIRTLNLDGEGEVPARQIFSLTVYDLEPTLDQSSNVFEVVHEIDPGLEISIINYEYSEGLQRYIVNFTVRNTTSSGGTANLRFNLVSQNSVKLSSGDSSNVYLAPGQQVSKYIDFFDWPYGDSPPESIYIQTAFAKLISNIQN